MNRDVWLRVRGTATNKDYTMIFLGCIPLGCQANDGCNRKSTLLGEVSVQCRFPVSAIKPMFRIGSRSEGGIAEVCFHCLHALCVEGSERRHNVGLTEDESEYLTEDESEAAD
jgi:hypothetical protein